MNYMPSGTVNQTSCKDCIFALYDGTTQVGCEDNRIEKFEDDIVEAYDNDKEFFVINRLCTLYRTSAWNNGIKDLEKAKKESYISCDILIDCNNINENMAAYLNKIIPKLSTKNKIKIFCLQNATISTKEMTKNLFYNHPSLLMSMCTDKTEYTYLNIMKASSMFHIILDETNYEDVDCFIEHMNNHINEKMQKALIFKHDNKIAMLSLACRILYPTLYLNYDNEYPEIEKQIKNSNLYIEL